MKKWIGLLFVAAFALCVQAGLASAAAPQTAAAKVVPKLYLNGKQLDAKVPPALINSSVLVPIRTVAENLGYEVGWDSKKKQVSVEEGSTKILMTLNDPQATVNGKKVTLTSPPLLQSDTTLIPIRFVGETFGLQVLWDNETKAAFLFTDSSAGSPDTGSGQNDGTENGAGNSSGEESEDGGHGSDSDPGSGSQPGKNPTDGGLIGVIEPEDGGNGVDGSSPNGGTDGSGGAGHAEEETEGTSGTGEQDGGAPAVDPYLITAVLSQIRYEPDMVVLTYEGTLKPTVNVLRDPDRIVIDLPHADFADAFAAGFSNGLTPDFMVVNEGAPAPGNIAELTGTGHTALDKIRYSRYTDSPKTIRVVLDLNQPWGYEVLQPFDGRTIVKLKKPAEPPKSGYTVVLDAGHGGSDPGAQSVTGKWEKEFNLSVVKKVQAILAAESKINLVLTRSGDTYPTLDERVELANSLKADLFVSVHGNSYKPEINGTETYYTREESLAFAKLLHKNAVAATGFKDNGVRKAGFKVIKYTTMPAVLLEVGYLSNESNGKTMFTDAFQERVAAAIAASIKQYFHLS